MHTLYDLETQIPTFFHITPARVHDTKAMDVIPYEENSFYIFDRGYNDFKRLHNIESIGDYFVIRGKTNNDFKPMKWKLRFPPESGILSDAIGYMAGQLTMEKYPDKIRRVIYLDKESKKKFIFFTNALPSNHCRTLSQQVADRAVLQMGQATSEDKKVLGYVRKLSPHSDLLCDHSLLHDGYSAEKDEHRTLYLRDATDCKYLINRYYQPSRPLCKT